LFTLLKFERKALYDVSPKIAASSDSVQPRRRLG
jgi:hypothetical protein